MTLGGRVMLMAFKRAMATLLVASTVLAVPSFFAESPDAPRLPNQQHNRMICIKTDAVDHAFVDMPGHWDVGSPSISPNGKWVVFDSSRGSSSSPPDWESERQAAEKRARSPPGRRAMGIGLPVHAKLARGVRLWGAALP
jgi:hypothetical protein